MTLPCRTFHFEYHTRSNGCLSVRDPLGIRRDGIFLQFGATPPGITSSSTVPCGARASPASRSRSQASMLPPPDTNMSRSSEHWARASDAKLHLIIVNEIVNRAHRSNMDTRRPFRQSVLRCRISVCEEAEVLDCHPQHTVGLPKKSHDGLFASGG